MSRLDWFTIVLVTLLLGALGFLIYKTVQLIQQDGDASPNTEISASTNAEDPATYQNSGSAQTDNATAPDADDQDLDDDELSYDPQEVEAPVAEEEKSSGRAAKTENSAAAQKQASREPEPARTASTETTPKGGTPTSYNTSGAGDFMVVAGSFSLRHNADNQVTYLKEMGYNGARVEMIQGGALASAMVAQFSDRNSAQRLVSELKGKGVDAIIKKKE